MTGFRESATFSPLLWAANNPFASLEFLATVGLLVGTLLIAAVILYYVDTWRKRQEARSIESAESLSNFRTMYDRGELTDAEYRNIRDRVAGKVKHEVAISNPANNRVGPQGTETDPGVQETQQRPASELPPKSEGEP